MLPRGGAALAIVAALATTAGAQAISDELPIERFRLAVDSAGILGVESAVIPEHMRWSAGVLVGFAHEPLVLYDRDMNAVDAVVKQRLTTALVGSLALGKRVVLGAGADLVGYQSGSDSITMQSLPSAGLGDLRMLGKVGIVRGDRWQVAALGTLTIPGGGAKGFLREPGVAFAPALAASLTSGRMRAAANVGYLVRKRVDTAGLVSDDEGFARIGVAARLGPAHAPAAELWWSTTVAAPLSGAEHNQIALEMLLGVTRQLTPTVAAFVAAGVGLDNGFGTPDWRALGGVRIAPATQLPPAPPAVVKPRVPTDVDKDGIVDDTDRCANAVEDRDGFRDDDGCPDATSRLDGMVTDPEGRPIRGATVVITQTEAAGVAPIELVTGEDGKFTTQLHGGALTIAAKAKEYQDGSESVVVEPGTTGNGTVKLVRAVRQGQLRGQVLSFSGQPVNGATISIKGKAASTSATTDAEGQFTIELPEGAFTVEIAAPGHVSQQRNVKIKLDGVTVLNVDLRSTK